MLLLQFSLPNKTKTASQREKHQQPLHDESVRQKKEDGFLDRKPQGVEIKAVSIADVPYPITDRDTVCDPEVNRRNCDAQAPNPAMPPEMRR